MYAVFTGLFNQTVDVLHVFDGQKMKSPYAQGKIDGNSNNANVSVEKVRIVRATVVKMYAEWQPAQQNLL